MFRLWFTILQLLSVYPEEEPDDELEDEADDEPEDEADDDPEDDPDDDPDPELAFTCWLGPKAPEKVNIPDPEVPVELC